ncbi:MAG: AI-2E family transporter [Anaerolineae bacterium]|nr:AI-2E family transporter [Anaerolineae bacterium]
MAPPILAHTLLYPAVAPAAGAAAGGDALRARDVLPVVVRTLAVAATLAALYLLFLLRRLVLTLFAAIIFASAVRPVVLLMRQRLRMSQTAAVLSLYAALGVGLAAGLAAAVPSMVSETAALLSRSADAYGRWYEAATVLRADASSHLGLALPMLPPEAEVQAWIAGAAESLQQALPHLALKATEVVADIVLGLVMAYYWLEARDGLIRYGQLALPGAQRGRLLAICDDMERTLGGYLGGQLALSLLIGVASLVAFLVIGLPDPVPLALIGAVLHVVPVVGATVGVIPPILVAISISPAKGLLTAATLVLIHQIENHFVAPRVLQRQVGISPLLVIIALAAGAMLNGVVGALLAVPAAGAAWVLVRNLFIQPMLARRRPGEGESERLAARIAGAGDGEQRV